MRKLARRKWIKSTRSDILRWQISNRNSVCLICVSCTYCCLNWWSWCYEKKFVCFQNNLILVWSYFKTKLCGHGHWKDFSRGGTRGFFQNFSRGKKWWNLFFHSTLRKQSLFAKILKIHGGQGPHAPCRRPWMWLILHFVKEQPVLDLLWFWI